MVVLTKSFRGMLLMMMLIMLMGVVIEPSLMGFGWKSGTARSSLTSTEAVPQVALVRVAIVEPEVVVDIVVVGIASVELSLVFERSFFNVTFGLVVTPKFFVVLLTGLHAAEAIAEVPIFRRLRLETASMASEVRFHGASASRARPRASAPARP